MAVVSSMVLSVSTNNKVIIYNFFAFYLTYPIILWSDFGSDVFDILFWVLELNDRWCTEWNITSGFNFAASVKQGKISGYAIFHEQILPISVVRVENLVRLVRSRFT